MIGGGELLLTLLLEGGDPFGGACRMVGGRPGLVRFAFGCFGFCHGSGLRVEAKLWQKFYWISREARGYFGILQAQRQHELHLVKR